MRKQGMTVREAAEEWVREFNSISRGMIEKLMQIDPGDWYEVTFPSEGDQVYVFAPSEGGKEHYGYIQSYDEESELYCIELDDGKLLYAEEDDFEVVRDDCLPMWSTMWSMSDPCDNHWLENMDGVRVMSDCGFRVYESEEFGFFWGIDGAGYSFMDEHFIPLYRARGLQWHDPDTEKEAV